MSHLPLPSQWEAVRSHRRSTSTSPFYSQKLHTLAALIAHQAPGLPLASHALFLRSVKHTNQLNHCPTITCLISFFRHCIDSVTLRGMGSGLNSKPIFSLARYETLFLSLTTSMSLSFPPAISSPLSFRALEGSFRSLNNLLERLHHSEFFYYAPSRGRFISIGQFMPPLALLLAPLVLEISSEIGEGAREGGV